jgi:hypothetical protein
VSLLQKKKGKGLINTLLSLVRKYFSQKSSAIDEQDASISGEAIKEDLVITGQALSQVS